MILIALRDRDLVIYDYPRPPSHFFVIHALLTFNSAQPTYILLLTRDFSRMGELEPWIDENFIRSVWFGMGEQVNVKMIRDKFSG